MKAVSADGTAVLRCAFPESFAERTGLGPGSPVELSLRDARLIVAPLRQPPFGSTTCCAT